MPVIVLCRGRVLPAILAVMIIAMIVIAGADVACAQAPAFGAPRPLAPGGIAGWVLAQQAIFYRSLAGMIRSAKTDGTALWTPSRVFNTGDVAEYQGKKYVAQYWTRNQLPGKANGPWKLLG